MGKSLQLLENYYTRQPSLKTGEPKVNSGSHCVSFYIRIKPVRCLDGALNNRGGCMKKDPASWHFPGVGLQKAHVQQDQHEHQDTRWEGRLHHVKAHEQAFVSCCIWNPQSTAVCLAAGKAATRARWGT